jgi:hypothetical protein
MASTQRRKANLSMLPCEWRKAPRRWGHPLHSLCSYLAMFPPQIPAVFIHWLTDPGDLVFDPFSGRGTTVLQAALMDRGAAGSDANPLATVLTASKADVPAERETLNRLRALASDYEAQSLEAVPRDIRMLYSPSTLRQILYLRSALNYRRRADRLIAAAAIGMLHANHCKSGASRGLSISMPNTFAMSPSYVRRYIKEKGLRAPKVDVFEALTRRIRGIGLPDSPVCAGRAWQHDAVEEFPSALKGRVKLIFTSPPYLSVIKYGKYNWVRLWFLGKDPREVDSNLTATSSLNKYLDFIKEVSARLRVLLRGDGRLCLVLGDVRNEKREVNLAREVWESVLEPAGWRLDGLIADHLPSRHKVSRIWGENKGRATKTDRILILSTGANDLPLPAAPRMTWERNCWRS